MPPADHASHPGTVNGHCSKQISEDSAASHNNIMPDEGELLAYLVAFVRGFDDGVTWCSLLFQQNQVQRATRQKSRQSYRGGRQLD